MGERRSWGKVKLPVGSGLSPQSLCLPRGLGASWDGPDPLGSWHGDGGQVVACKRERSTPSARCGGNP